MLLNFSNGNFPPLDWTDKTGDAYIKLLTDFLEDQDWEVTVWNELSIQELLDIYEASK